MDPSPVCPIAKRPSQSGKMPRRKVNRELPRVCVPTHMVWKSVFRRLARSPIFSLTFCVLLTCGIASNTALLTLVDAICFRPLSVPHPEQLVRVVQRVPDGRERTVFPYMFYEALRDRSSAFAHVAGELDEQVVMSKAIAPEMIHVHLVTPGFFQLFSVPALYGRRLVSGDETASSTTPPAVLSYFFWRQEFSASQGAIGQTIDLDGHPFVVVGVMPRSFNGLSADASPEVRVPFRALSLLAKDKHETINPFVSISARLKPGTNRLEAETQTIAIWRQAITRYWPQMYPDSPAADASLNEDMRLGVGLESGRRGVSEYRSRYGTGWFVLALSSLVFEIMLCANLATIVLSRNIAYSNDIATRIALGATRRRVLTELLLEGAVLAMIGAAAGITCAYGLVPVLTLALPPIRDLMNSHITTALVVGRDFRPLVIGSVLSLISYFAFGLAPAVYASARAVTVGLQSGRMSRSLRGQNSLLFIQVVICTLLMACAGMLSRTVLKLRQVNVGFDSPHVVSFTVDPRLVGYTQQNITTFVSSVTENIKQLPSVVSVGSARFPVMRGSGMKLTVMPDGTPMPESMPPNTSVNSVSPSYFQTMGVRLIAGRPFSRMPVGKQSSSIDVLINQAFAQRFFPNTSPLGRHFGTRRDQALFEIQGVVSDAKLRSVREPIQPTFYTNELGPDRVLLYVRTAGTPSSIIEPVRKLIYSLDPRLPVTDVHTLAEEIDLSIADDRLNAWLANVFALFAIVLSALGVFGLVALIGHLRRKEIAIRLALGATRTDIMEVVGRGLAIILTIGIAFGLSVLVIVAKFLQSLLYGISTFDPSSIVISIVGIAFVALVAASIPLARAAYIDPAAALHEP